MARRARQARQRRSADGRGNPRIVPPAGFAARAAAFAIDLLVVIGLTGVIISNVPWPLSGLFSVSAVTLIFVVGWTAPLGQSFGGRFLQLEVIGTDGESLTFARALLRLAALVAGTLFFFLGPASALADERRQAWHDKVARSYVIGLKTFGESMRDLESAVTYRSEWRPRPIVVTPQKPRPLVLVFVAAAVPSAITGFLLYLGWLLRPG